MKIVFGVFIILHGIVHLLYFGQANRYFELKPGMTWPTSSWVFSAMPGDGTGRFLISVLLVLAGLGFIASGIGTLFNQGWQQTLIIATSIVSALLFVSSWNGRMQNLDGQGVVGILIDIWLLVMVMVVRWPQVNR